MKGATSMKRILKALGIVSEKEMKKEISMLKLEIFDKGLEIIALDHKIDQLETILSVLNGELTELKYERTEK